MENSGPTHQQRVIKEAEAFAYVRRVAHACPVCPRCKEPLIFREHQRRFIENEHIQQCANGHVWSLREEEPI